MINEPIDILNKRLTDIFGSDTLSGLPIYRIVWSEDQYEMRETNFSDAGIELLKPEVRLLPKYKQWIHNRWVLEWLCIVPKAQQKELAEKQISYEPLYVFQDNKGNALPPKWEAMEFLILNQRAMMAAARGEESTSVPFAKYLDNPVESDAKELDKIYDDLFGNESDVTDALAYGDGVVVPSNYKKENE